MESRDGLFRHLDGVGCTVCGKPIDGGRIRLLAQREEHAFVELECVAWGTTTIGIVTIDDEDPAAARLDSAPVGAFGPAHLVRLPAGITYDIVAVDAILYFHVRFRENLRTLVWRSRDDCGVRY